MSVLNNHWPDARQAAQMLEQDAALHTRLPYEPTPILISSERYNKLREAGYLNEHGALTAKGINALDDALNRLLGEYHYHRPEGKPNPIDYSPADVLRGEGAK